MDGSHNHHHHHHNESNGEDDLNNDCCEDEHDELPLPSVGGPPIVGGGGMMVLGATGGTGASTDNDFGGSNNVNNGHQQQDEVEKNLDDVSNFLESESTLFHQRMWGCFQNCARAVTQVYMLSKQPAPPQGEATRRSSSGVESSRLSQSCGSSSSNHYSKKLVEESFKSAAQHATSLYKDSIETSRRLVDLGVKTGLNRRTKEILSFVKSRKKKFIRKDELISFLIGGGSGNNILFVGKKEVLNPASSGGGNVGGGTRTKHVHFAGLSNNSGGGTGVVVNGSGAGLFENSFGNPGIPNHQSVYQNQSQFGSTLGGPFSLPPQSQQPTNTPTQRDLHPSNNSSSTFNLQNSTTQNNIVSSRTDNDSQFLPSPHQPQQDPFLQLAVQQLFVAGGGGTTIASSLSSSSQFSPNPHSPHPQIAGVKRPAPQDRLPIVKEEDGNSFLREGLNSNNLEGRRGELQEGIIVEEEEEEDDSMMEDSVDGESSLGFKRMRFY